MTDPQLPDSHFVTSSRIASCTVTITAWAVEYDTATNTWRTQEVASEYKHSTHTYAAFSSNADWICFLFRFAQPTLSALVVTLSETEPSSFRVVTRP